MGDSVAETTARTREALQKVLDSKLHGGKKNQKTQDGDEVEYIKYTPNNTLPIGGSHKQRVIKIVDKAEDPMMPPKFKLRKTPEGPSDDQSVPVLHKESTPKITKEEQRKWSIPPAISNWKNTKGFTISIDKRLSTLDEDTDKYTLSDKFSVLSQALENAHSEARNELKERAKLRQELERKKLLNNQQRLSRIAREARRQRGSIDEEDKSRIEGKYTENKELAALKREQMRMERRKKAEKELRMKSMGTEAQVKILAKEQGREVSERVALGVATSKIKEQGVDYDPELYMKASGSNTRHSHGQIYDSPLFGAQDAVNDIYRARDSGKYKGLGVDTAKKEIDRIGNEKHFEGLDSSGPVEFSKANKKDVGDELKKSGLIPRKRQWDE